MSIIRFSAISCSTNRYVTIAISSFPSALLIALNLYALSGRSRVIATVNSGRDELANVSSMLVLDINSSEDGILLAAKLASVIVISSVI